MRIILFCLLIPIFGIAQNEDCSTALKICNKNDLIFANINNAGLDRNEGRGTCLGEGVGSFEDSHTQWIYFTVRKAGILSFVIQPLNFGDDVDFAFFELPDGIGNCATRKVLRCNATAPPCAYNSGLNLTSVDTVENFNCNPGEDGFCKFVELSQSKTYALMISLFSQSGAGVKLSFDGSVELEDIGCFVSVDDPKKNSIKFYPNPASHLIYSTSDLSVVDDIKIYDISGRVITNYGLKNNKAIDISNLNEGIYLIRLRHKNGTYSMSRILVTKD